MRMFHTCVKRARACIDIAATGMNDVKFNAANLSRLHTLALVAYARERILKLNSHLRLYDDGFMTAAISRHDTVKFLLKESSTSRQQGENITMSLYNTLYHC